MTRDFLVRCDSPYATVFLVIPQNEGCERWLEDNTQGTWFGKGLVVEHRYLANLVRGLEAEGYVGDWV